MTTTGTEHELVEVHHPTQGSHRSTVEAARALLSQRSNDWACPELERSDRVAEVDRCRARIAELEDEIAALDGSV